MLPPRFRILDLHPYGTDKPEAIHQKRPVLDKTRHGNHPMPHPSAVLLSPSTSKANRGDP